MERLLKRFSPLDELKEKNLHALALKTQLQSLPRGGSLFRQGDNDNKYYFLVSGSVELRAKDRVMEVIKAGTPEARTALTPITPRKYTARAAEDIQYVSIDSDFFDAVVTWDQTGYYEVAELEQTLTASAIDWQTTLLQTPAFHRIPPSNIQTIFMRMERVNHPAGDVIIKQGSAGDYFYVVVSGTCLVRRETPLSKEGIKLAELSSGASFGEEALITDAKRNATVTMLTDGTLMRLSKSDFQTLLYEPQLRWIESSQAKSLIAKGGKWLDVRLPNELSKGKIAGAINLPLHILRLKLTALDRDVAYVICCDTGRRSSAAAFILSERGFDAYALKGGVGAMGTN